MSNAQSSTILDHIDGIRVPGDPFQEPANEYWALLCLRSGLEYLYKQALQCEEAAKERLNLAANVRISISGKLTGLPSDVLKLLTCGFHWYAVSACNYARLVGAIAYGQDRNRPEPPAYIKRVMPEMLAFRDKVAAHFAWSTQNSRDNDAERLASVIPQLSFHGDSFYVASLTVHARRSGKVSDSGVIARWSIVKEHEKLQQRYWPQPGGEHHPPIQ